MKDKNDAIDKKEILDTENDVELQNKIEIEADPKRKVPLVWATHAMHWTS